MKKKTIFIWVMIIILIISILAELISLFTITAPMIEYVMNIVTIIIYSVLTYKLIKLQLDSVKWVHIAFIWTALGMIYNFSSIVSVGGGLTTSTTVAITIFCIIFAILWFTFVKHLKKVQASV
jgi:hypothetical protein